MTPEQKARLAELRAKAGGQPSGLTPQQSSRLQELRAKVGIGAAPKRGLLQALLPGATREHTPYQAPIPFSYSGLENLGRPMYRTVGSGEQQALAGIMDALSLPTRAAGTVGGALGYEGATGGKQGLQALADPETGLARPQREFYQEALSNALRGGEDGQRGLMDWLKVGGAGAGFLASSIAEDPLTFLGGLAKAAPKTVASISKPAEVVAEAAGKGLQKVGKEQMYKVIKPLLGAERKAKKPIEDVIFEYGLDQGGRANPRAIFDASSKKIEELGSRLKAEIKAGRDAGARVDVEKEIDQVVSDFKAKAGDSPDYYANAKDIDAIAADFKARAASAGKGKPELDLWQAQNFKQYLGNEGAWQHIAKQKGIPLKSEETARSQVAEMIYHRLNDAIDQGAPNGVRDLNRQLSELIPVKQAAGHRAIVASRNNRISLTDVITGTAAAMNPKLWPVYAVNSLSKSGTMASKIYRIGEALRTAKTPAAANFYVRSLKRLGLASAEIEALRSGRDLGGQALEPLRKVAEKDKQKEAVAYGGQ